ncbi:hypothetical protein [Pseudoclavibacter sp. RFBA6]|uniref:hypothetical protein n=1 Tax=Pseudoclavibacter sp. RFBA6 TaxID=2080573 RepID=UPI000CE90D9D|nr:hypothetical protein [Pseudoclavibacter sp. RFBA6]PPG39795.1 hypothetical protein C5C17_12625 [Pseudoclavibacter sp. RFBA6]
MKKVVKTLVRSIAAGFAVVALGLLSTTAMHAVASVIERGRIEPYAQRIDLDGRQVNVLVAGDAAAETVVLLPGFGTAAPVLDFQPLVGSNLENALGTSFPEQLPLLLFVEADCVNNSDWIGLHERQAAEVGDGTVVLINGAHSLHHTHAAEIEEDLREWQRVRSL